MEDLVAYAQEHKIKFKIQDNLIELTIDEHEISQLLTELSKRNVHYRNITIQKPTLEDYFLEISRASRKGIA